MLFGTSPLPHAPFLAPASSAALAKAAGFLGLHAKAALAWASTHTGVPALVVAAVALVVGYRVLRRSARFAVEVAVVSAALVFLTHLGMIRW